MISLSDFKYKNPLVHNGNFRRTRAGSPLPLRVVSMIPVPSNKRNKNTLHSRCDYSTSVYARCLNLWSVVFSIDFFLHRLASVASNLARTSHHQYSLDPAGMWSSTMRRCRSSLPSFWLTALMTMPQLSMLIILRGGRLVMAIRVLPMSSSGS